MEIDVAILIADLSGYTALTETHGAIAAADLVDRYITIVKNCLVGDSQLHERTGDEVMIVSSSPDHLLASSLLLLQTAHTEENFLLLHGGLHFGKLLYRNNSYFGTAINLSSRIASMAKPGQIWASQDFISALAGSISSFTSTGKHLLKNISEETELFELQPGNNNKLYIDPVCRMLIINEQNAVSHPSAPGVYFCSENCMNIFLAKAELPV